MVEHVSMVKHAYQLMLAYGMQLCYFPTPMNSTVDQPPRPAEDSDIVYVQRPSETNPEGEQDNGTSASKTYYCFRGSYGGGQSQ